MIVKLQTEHHLEFLSLKGGSRGVRVYTCQNVTLLEISCRGSFFLFQTTKLTLIVIVKGMAMITMIMTASRMTKIIKRIW